VRINLKFNRIIGDNMPKLGWLTVILLTVFMVGCIDHHIYKEEFKGRLLGVYEYEGESEEELYQRLVETETGVGCIVAIDSHTGESINADIYVNGKYTGYSTPKCFYFKPGFIKITLKAPGYEDASRDVIIISGDFTNFGFSMKRISVSKQSSLVQIEYGVKYEVRVIDVIDGDTIEVQFQDRTETIRILGIDTPEIVAEKNKPYEYKTNNLECLADWGLKAKKFVNSMLNGKTVQIEFDEKAGLRDSFGRLLAYVYVDGKDFGKMLVEKGYARVYVEGEFSKRNEYLKAEERAFNSGVGIWSCRVKENLYTLAQWAKTARASSEYSASKWSAMQSTGPPDTSTCGDHPTAWAPKSSGAEPEWLEVYFDTPVYARELNIHETYNSGFIYRIDLIDTEGRYHHAWSGKDYTPCPGWFNISLNTDYKVIGVKIYTQIQGWEEIDAVRLVGYVSSLTEVKTTPTSTPSSIVTPTPVPQVKIYKVNYNAPGNDRYNLNGEYVVIKNYGDAVNLKGWKLRDEYGHTYVFPSVVIPSGGTITIYTGSGIDTQTELYWGRDWPVWNNDGDTAYLYDSLGRLVDSYSYTGFS